jgi:hypothetical protein
MRTLLFVSVLLLLNGYSVAVAQVTGEGERGFLEAPPVYVIGEPDVPLAGFGAYVPPPGETVPDFESVTVESAQWRRNGIAVQPDLFVKQGVIRLGVLRGIKGGWAAGASIPQIRTLVGGEIEGQPSTCTRTGFGTVLLAAKNVLWQEGESNRLVGAVGIDLPTGTSDAHFDQHNSSTDAYYPTDPGRLPISWQPSPGTTNGVVGISYARYVNRWSYGGLALAKLYGRGFADSKIGNFAILSGSASYGVARWCAASLGLTLRMQGDDSYPGVNPPVVDQPALVATTTHGTTLYLDPSLRFLVGGRLVIGVDARYPIVRPENGMVPAVRVGMIFYPAL